MKNVIVSLIELFVIGILVSWNETIVCLLWLLPIIGYSFYQIIKKTKEEETIVASLKDIFIGNIINLIIFLILLCIVYFIFENFPKTRSYNTFLFPMFILLNENVFNPSVGMKCRRIRIVNDEISDKIKILLNNFLIISPVYVMFFSKQWQFVYAYQKSLIESLLFLNVCNLFVRIFVARKKSLFELILNIKYENDMNIQN